jgi:hypothetical protein
MQRHFVSYAPRFGSYKEPRPFLVKQSPYYWWWLALTLNEEYATLCEQQQRQRASTSRDSFKAHSDMLKVYEDFGDVRYDGDRYRAFCDWWRNRVNTNGEERGIYLFAEPLRGVWTHIVEDGERAAEYAEQDDWLVIAIPLPQQRRYVDKSINRLLKKHLPSEHGKRVDPAEHSQALYHLSKPVLVKRLERALTLYELKHSQRGKRMSNAKLADAVGLTTTPSQKRMANEAVDARAQKNTVATLVSRELRYARGMIARAGVGEFP